MKFSLRDLFWLVLVVAIVVSWLVERRQIEWAFASSGSRNHIQELDAGSDYWGSSASELQRLTDAEFSALFAQLRGNQDNDVYLLEAGRRHLQDPLQKILDFRKQSESTSEVWDNRVLLTALRRAEGKPDPLRIEIHSLGKDAKGRQVAAPLIVPRVTNIDFGGESLYSDDGYFVREHWRIQLTNERGELVREIGWIPSDYFGENTSQMLPPGQSAKPADPLDMRDYLETPRPGRYTLQLVHSPDQIAGSNHSWNGRFLWKSAPVAVVVEDLSLPSKWRSLLLPLAIVAAGLLVGFAASVFSKPVLNRRDAVLLIVIVLLALAWAANAFSLKQHFEQAGRTRQPNWTMRFAAESR